MDVRNRITRDFDEIIRLLENQLDKLRVFRFDSKYRSLLGDSFVESLGKWEKDILSRKEDPFTIVVCGEFKRGKSSLINALLEEDVVPANVTAETVTLNRISYGSHANEAVLSKGKRLQLSDEEMKRENLESIMKDSSISFKEIEIHRPIPFLKEAVIIDTPGLGDSMQDFSEMVEEVLSQADAVIYVFSVNYPLSQTEQLFLKTVILPQKYTTLMLAGNYLDMLNSQKDYDRMEELLMKRIHGLLPDQKPWMVSALDERCRQLNEERPNPRQAAALEEHFDQFRNELMRLTEEKKDTVLPDRMQRMFRNMLEELSENLQALENGLNMSLQDAKEAAERVHEQKEHQIQTHEENSSRIDECISWMKTQSREWMDELLNQMQNEVSKLNDVPAEDLSKYYTFYCIDTIQEGINRCLEYHTMMLYDELENISGELAKKVSGTAVNSSCGFRFTLDNRTWTRGDNVSYVISKVNSLALLSLVADGIAGAMRQKELSKKTPDILRSIGSQFPGLRVSAEQAIESSYSQMADNAKKQLSEYYSERIHKAEEFASQSEMVARQNEEQKDEIRKAINEIRSVFHEIEEELEGV